MSTVHRIPEGLLELAELERGAWDERSAAIASAGVPTNDGTELLKAVEGIDGAIAELRQEHADKFRAAREVEGQVTAAIAKGEQITPDHELFTKMDDATKAAHELEDRIAGQETVKAGLVKRLAEAGVEVKGEGNQDRDATVAALRELRESFAGGLAPPNPKSAGQRVTEAQLYRDVVASGRLMRQNYGEDVALGEAMTRDELKAALITGSDPGSAGAFVTPMRTGYYPLPLRPLTVLDLITIGQTDSDLIEYVRMLSLTNAAAEVPEAITAAPIDGTTVTAVQGGRKPESGMAFEIVQEAVSTIAHWVPATKRSLADAGQVRTIIDGALRWGLGDRLERQLLIGDGVGDNLLGVFNQPGLNSIAAGPDSHADKIHRAMTQVLLDGFQTTGILINPLDAETIWLSRDGAGGAPGTGGYLFGNPNNPGPRTLWGRAVAETPAVPQGSALVGNLQAIILWLREGTQVLASDSHVDFFTRNLVAVLAEMRAGSGVPTPGALAEVDLDAA